MECMCKHTSSSSRSSRCAYPNILAVVVVVVLTCSCSSRSRSAYLNILAVVVAVVAHAGT